MTYEEIADQYPAEFAERDADKYHYRYPGGEVCTCACISIKCSADCTLGTFVMQLLVVSQSKQNRVAA